MCRQSIAELCDQRREPGGALEQRVEIQPEIAVVAGLQPEVASSSPQQPEQLGFHVAVTLACSAGAVSHGYPPGADAGLGDRAAAGGLNRR
jgi:hypothetical protein